MVKDKWVCAVAVILVTTAAMGAPTVFGLPPEEGSWKYLVGVIGGAFFTASMFKDGPQP